MKKPICNELDRLNMREIDCLSTALMQLNLAALHVRRDIHQFIKKTFNL